MRGILWHVTRKLEGIFDGILMEFHMRMSEDKNQIQKSIFPSTYPPVFMVELLLLLYIVGVGSSSDSRKARTATPTIL